MPAPLHPEQIEQRAAAAGAGTQPANRIEASSKLRHLLQTLFFCVLVSAIEQAFSARQTFMPSVVYSTLIGTTICAVVDLGRHFMPSAAETGWPQGWGGLLLVLGGIVTGFLVGKTLGDLICSTFGLFPRGRVVNSAADLRSSILITGLAGIAGSYWFYAHNRGEYLLRKMREAQKHAEDARLKVLETQLEPHMLFNTLANLRALIALDPVRAQEMLDHMIAYLRSTLDASRATTHPLRAEFDRLGDYLELMKIRMGPRLAYTLDLPDDAAGVPVPALLLQPLVENSIQHGLEPKVEGGRIAVRARRDGDRLLIEVDDTGVGEVGLPSNGNGFGLTQIRERLKSMYAERAALDFRCDAGGAHARIHLPIA
jgi:hypothetical protein